MHHIVATTTGFGGKCNNEMNLWCPFHYCDKCHTVVMNQIVFRREFVKLIWGNENYFKPCIHNESFTPQMAYM